MDERLRPIEKDHNHGPEGQLDILRDWDMTVEKEHIGFDKEELKEVVAEASVNHVPGTTLYVLQQCGLVEDPKRRAIIERINEAYDYYEWLKYNHTQDIGNHLRPDTETLIYTQPPGKRYPEKIPAYRRVLWWEKREFISPDLRIEVEDVLRVMLAQQKNVQLPRLEEYNRENAA